MTGLGRSLVHGVAAAAVGFGGLAAGRCAGGSCSTCLACVVPGIALVMVGVLGRVLPQNTCVPRSRASDSDSRDVGHAIEGG